MCYIYGRRMLSIGDRAFENIDSVVSKINTMVTDSLSSQAFFRVCVLTLYIYEGLGNEETSPFLVFLDYS